MAPSWQVGVHAGAEVVVDGRQIVGVAVTVTVDAEQVFVALVEVAHVLGEDATEVLKLVVLGDDVGVADVVADDLTGLLCEVVLAGDVDDTVVLGTLMVVLRYISPTTQHSFSVNVALPMVSHQCRYYNTVSIESTKVTKCTYHPCAMTVSSQLDRLDNTLHKELPLGQLEMEGTLLLTSKAVQNATAGAKP